MGAKKERGFHLRVQVPRGPRLGLIMTIKNQQQQIIINIVRVKTKTNKQTKTNRPTTKNSNNLRRGDL